MAILALGLDSAAGAQEGFPPPPPKVSFAAGVIDIHLHPESDVFGGELKDIELATVARRNGMRGLVLKNHVVTTADRASTGMEAMPGIEIWGGSCSTSRWAASTRSRSNGCTASGDRGKVVWLPPFDSDMHVKTLVNKSGSGLVVAPEGKVTPEMEGVLKIIARENLLFATGHFHADEVVAVTKRASTA